MWKQVLGVILILLGLLMIGTNWLRQIENYSNGKKGIDKHSSPCPFFGPMFLIMGWTYAGGPSHSALFFAFLLDPDTVITVIGLPIALYKILRK